MSPGRKDLRDVPYASDTDKTAVWPAGVPFVLPIVNGECRFAFETRGPWSLLVKLEGLAVEKTATGVRVWGVRALKAPKESGYNHEGRVNVGGETLRAFTSSQLFLVEGKLVDVGILYVCRPKVHAKGGHDQVTHLCGVPRKERWSQFADQVTCSECIKLAEHLLTSGSAP
jgi:hypothetical protein